MGNIGPGGKTAIGALTELPGRGSGQAAAEALGKIGPAVIPTLTELLKDKKTRRFGGPLLKSREALVPRQTPPSLPLRNC